MIPRANIVAWRNQFPWPTDEQVEQDLVLSRAVIDIFSEPILSSSLAFRGGTALHKLFFKPAGRYSEDIDLVQVHSGPAGAVMDALRARLDPWLGKAKWKQGEGRVTLLYRFDSEVPPITKLRLKVEINTREHFSVLGFKKHPLKLQNAWFSGDAEINTYALEELLATKLRALYQRKKGRDLFDLAFALERFPSLNKEKVASCFVQYMEHENLSISQDEFLENIRDKISDRAFCEDIEPVLSFDLVQSHISFLVQGRGRQLSMDAERAFQMIRESFLKHLPC